jgi:SPOR domain
LKKALCFGFGLTSFYILSQSVSIEKDPKIDILIQEKKKINSENVVSDRIRIQIFNGELEDCKKEIDDFKKKFSDLEGAIEFNHPFYKVLIGNFKTRLEAERNLLLIKKKYPNAFLVKPRTD